MGELVEKNDAWFHFARKIGGNEIVGSWKFIFSKFVSFFFEMYFIDSAIFKLQYAILPDNLSHSTIDNILL